MKITITIELPEGSNVPTVAVETDTPDVETSDVLAEPTGTTFDFGGGPVPAHRHINPDGTVGGWVANTARVEWTAYVGPFARVFDYARVEDSASILDHAQIADHALIADNAVVSEQACVLGRAVVANRAQVKGKADICGIDYIGGQRIVG